MSNAASFSRVQTYKKCPAGYEWQYLLGHKEEYNPGPAALRGTRIHNSIEDYYNGKREELDSEVPMDMVDHIVSHKRDGCEDARPEMKFALTKDWEITDFDAEDAFVRGFMDNVFLYPEYIVVHEYKSGKWYPEHGEQKALYGMICLIMFPQYQEVRVESIYTDHHRQKIVPSVQPTTYMRGMLSSMKYHWTREIGKLSLPMYPARPGFHCRWCPKSSKHKEGPCQVG